VNLLLIAPEELTQHEGCSRQLPCGSVTLSGRRAQHLLQVLKVEIGDTLRAGIIDGPKGTARIASVDGGSVRLQFTATDPPTQRGGNVLIMAIPRPVVLSRCLRSAAVLGYGRVLLIRSRRVEKSHLLSHVFHPDAINKELLLGLEQGRRTCLPRVEVYPRFRPFVEDALPALGLPAARILADPDAATSSLELLQATLLSPRNMPPTAPRATPSYCLALGPEGGWVPFELQRFEQAGFRTLRFGEAPLRVESALSLITGQLELLAPLGSLI
jgi:RsmE family RNA methyltransferase